MTYNIKLQWPLMLSPQVVAVSSTYLHGKDSTSSLPQCLLHGQLQAIQVMPLDDELHHRPLQRPLPIALCPLAAIHGTDQFAHGSRWVLQQGHSTIC